MNIALSLGFLATVLALGEAYVVGYPPMYGPGPVVRPLPYGPGPVVRPLPGYGGPGPYMPYARPATSSYDNSDSGASSNNFDSSDFSSFNNNDLLTDGGATHIITADKSGDNSYRGDALNSRVRHNARDSNDGYGNTYSRNFDDNAASHDRVDDNSGYARSNADRSFGFGADRDITDRNSKYVNNLDDRRRSKNTADDVYQYGPGGRYQSRYRNSGASMDIDHDVNDDANDAGQSWRDGGRDQRTYSLGSSRRSHKGDGKRSSRLDSDDISDDASGFKHRQVHDRKADKLRADDRDDFRHDDYADSLNFGQSMNTHHKTSRDRSQNDDGAASRKRVDTRFQDGPSGTSSSQDILDDSSKNIISAADTKRVLNADKVRDWGDNTDTVALTSDVSSANVDNAASNVRKGFNAGQDAYGKYDNKYDNAGASSLRKMDTAGKSTDLGSFVRGAGETVGSHATGSQYHTSKGSAKSSKNDNTRGKDLKL